MAGSFVGAWLRRFRLHRAFYGRVLDVVIERRFRAASFLLLVFMHALGHALVALVAGLLARGLVGGNVPGMPGSSGREFLTPGGMDLFALAWIGLAAMIFKVAGQTGAAYLQAKLSGEVGAWVRQRVLDAWLGVHRLHSPGQPDQGADDGNRGQPGPGWAQPMAALTDRVRELEVGLAAGLLGGTRAAAQLVPLVAVLILLSPRLAFASLVVFVPFGILLGRVRRRWKLAVARRGADGEALLEAADEAVRHADLWTTYGAGHKIREHLERLGVAMARKSARMEALASIISGANEILGALALVVALFAARSGWLGDEVARSGLLPFSIAFFMAYRPIRELTDARLSLTRGRIAVDALADLGVTWTSSWGGRTGHGDEPSRKDDDPQADSGALDPEWSLQPLEIESLVCSRGHAWPLSFRAAPGAIVVIVGPTGVGKSTLLRALLGLEVPQSGTVRYGDRILAYDAAPGPSTRPFAWVPQDAPVLLDTLDRNVRLAVGAESTARSLELVGAGHLVGALADARLGAGGHAISGGERQWIAIARAIATKMPVLVLDEPTSGLDPDSQARVLEAIARLRGKRTVIVVTHRTEPLAIADAAVRLGSPPAGDATVELTAA